MKLQYLGTAAAEGMPAPFCTCEDCEKARKWGGRNVRSRSQALVNDTLLLDFPGDTFYHAMLYGVDLLKVRHCLITHVHADHLCPAEAAYFRKGFSVIPEGFPPFHFYGSEDITAPLENHVKESAGNAELHVLRPFETADVAGHKVTPLKAAHGTAHPFIYLIEKDGQTLLYAHDTDVFPEETWEFLRARKPHLDAVSMDCTEGAKETIYRGAHMCITINEECRDRLMAEGLADERTAFALNHFSHNGDLSAYDEFAPFAAARGFVTSYDGMVWEF